MAGSDAMQPSASLCETEILDSLCPPSSPLNWSPSSDGSAFIDISSFDLLVLCGAIAGLCAETSRSLSFDVVALSLSALTWVVNTSDDADQIASIAVAFHKAAYSNFTLIRFRGLCGLEDAIRRHFVVACDLGGGRTRQGRATSASRSPVMSSSSVTTQRSWRWSRKDSSISSKLEIGPLL
jgi:hypothetical protein